MEITKGIFQASQNIYQNNKGSLLRTVIFTIGHFLIAITVLKLLDPGIELWVAMADAVIEPLVNAVLYFILDKIWVSKMISDEPPKPMKS